jgi:hypothetical protein
MVKAGNMEMKEAFSMKNTLKIVIATGVLLVAFILFGYFFIPANTQKLVTLNDYLTLDIW